MAESGSSKSGHRFAQLYQLSQTFSSSLDLAEVLDLVIDEVVKTLQAERGFIALWNENGAREFRSARGLHKTMIEQPEFEISRGVVEDVAKYGKVICISDAQSDDHFRKRPGFLDLSLRSILCAPLQLKDNILGVIYFDNRMIAGRIPATPVRGGQGEGGNSSALGELLCTFPPDKVVNSSCWGGVTFLVNWIKINSDFPRSMIFRNRINVNYRRWLFYINNNYITLLGDPTMKNFVLIAVLIILLLVACEPQANSTPTDPLVTPTDPLETSTATPEVFSTPTPSSDGTEVSYGPMTFVIPMEIADGASGEEVTPLTADDAPWWEKTPGHTQISLEDYYILQDKSLQPQVYVYSATDYAILNPTAFESMHRLRNMISGDESMSSPDQLPAVPFFNAAQVFASNIEEISFQNGSGIRFLTEYAQYAASVNNEDLFYHFQGLSDDGEYYIVAILPITMSKLAETSDEDADLPDGGIPYTYFTDGEDFDAQSYYDKITDLLNGTSPESFTPSITQLDALIESMVITP